MTPDEASALRAERDALRARAEEAEAIAEQLADSLAEAQGELARLRAQQEAFEIFDGGDAQGTTGSLAADGSDPHVLPVALGGTALVAALVAVLSLMNQGPFNLMTILMVGITVALAWAAWQTRVIHTRIAVEDGVVKVERGTDIHHFDLRSKNTRFEVHGQPGDVDWKVRFLRRGLDPVDVDARTVEPAEFMEKVRRYRPEA